MKRKRRKPKVPEDEVPVEECFDGHARITSKELATTHFVNGAPSRMLVLQDQEWLQIWGKVLSCTSPSKRSKKNDDKSAVAMLKKHELYDRTVKPVVCRDTRHEHHGPVVCNSSNTRQLGCVFQDMELPKLSSILRKSSDRNQSNV